MEAGDGRTSSKAIDLDRRSSEVEVHVDDQRPSDQDATILVDDIQEGRDLGES